MLIRLFSLYLIFFLTAKIIARKERIARHGGQRIHTTSGPENLANMTTTTSEGIIRSMWNKLTHIFSRDAEDNRLKSNGMRVNNHGYRRSQNSNPYMQNYDNLKLVKQKRQSINFKDRKKLEDNYFNQKANFANQRRPFSEGESFINTRTNFENKPFVPEREMNYLHQINPVTTEEIGFLGKISNSVAGAVGKVVNVFSPEETTIRYDKRRNLDKFNNVREKQKTFKRKTQPLLHKKEYLNLKKRLNPLNEENGNEMTKKKNVPLLVKKKDDQNIKFPNHNTQNKLFEIQPYLGNVIENSRDNLVLRNNEDQQNLARDNELFMKYPEYSDVDSVYDQVQREFVDNKKSNYALEEKINKDIKPKLENAENNEISLHEVNESKESKEDSFIFNEGHNAMANEVNNVQNTDEPIENKEYSNGILDNQNLVENKEPILQNVNESSENQETSNKIMDEGQNVKNELIKIVKFGPMGEKVHQEETKKLSKQIVKTVIENENIPGSSTENESETTEVEISMDTLENSDTNINEEITQSIITESITESTETITTEELIETSSESSNSMTEEQGTEELTLNNEESTLNEDANLNLAPLEEEEEIVSLNISQSDRTNVEYLQSLFAQIGMKNKFEVLSPLFYNFKSGSLEIKVVGSDIHINFIIPTEDKKKKYLLYRKKKENRKESI